MDAYDPTGCVCNILDSDGNVFDAVLSVPLFRRCVCADLAGCQLSDFKLRSVIDFGKKRQPGV